MIEWTIVNTPKIKRIAYNSRIEVMYIDFTGSTTDTPYQGVPKDIFIQFQNAKNIDEFYKKHFKDKYQEIEIKIENSVSYKV